LSGAVGQPAAGGDDVHGALPVFVLACCRPAVQVKATFIGWAVVSGIAVAPTVVFGVMLSPAKGPHVVQRPDDGLGDVADIGNRHHVKVDPMQVHHIGIRLVKLLVPARGNGGG